MGCAEGRRSGQGTSGGSGQIDGAERELYVGVMEKGGEGGGGGGGERNIRQLSLSLLHPAGMKNYEMIQRTVPKI